MAAAQVRNFIKIIFILTRNHDVRSCVFWQVLFSVWMIRNSFLQGYATYTVFCKRPNSLVYMGQSWPVALHTLHILVPNVSSWRKSVNIWPLDRLCRCKIGPHLFHLILLTNSHQYSTPTIRTLRLSLWTLSTTDDSGATWRVRLLLASFQHEVTPPLFFSCTVLWRVYNGLAVNYKRVQMHDVRNTGNMHYSKAIKCNKCN